MVDDKFMGADDSLCGGPIATVLGRRLLPMTLWHMWLLRNMENPYAVGGIPQGDDLCEVVLVCSLTRQQFAKAMRREMTQLTELLVGRWFMLSEEEMQDQSDILHDYLEAQTDTVEFWEDSNSDPVKDRLRCPPEWHLVLTLLRNNVVRDEQEAWDYPYNRAMAWRAVVNEAVHGSRDYVDPLDRKQSEALNNANH